MSLDIDLFKYGVKDTWEKIVGSAYEGAAPDGGYDFPSGATVSKCPDEYSSLHVDALFYDDFEDEPVSSDVALAVLNHGAERGPGTTDHPFLYPSSIVRYPGMFGGALKNFCEARAILLAGGSDVQGIDNWFRDCWALPDEFDLDYCTPNMRSQGAAMWGGISRVLKPLATLLPASVPGLRVVQHGQHRTDFGPDVLVDWARVTAIAQTIAVQMYADDYYANKRLPKMSFGLARHELPHAPPVSSYCWSYDYTRNRSEVGDNHDAMVLLIRKAKDLEHSRKQTLEERGIMVDVDPSLDRVLITNLSERNPLLNDNNVRGWYDYPDEGDILQIKQKPSGFIGKHLSMINTMDVLLSAVVKDNINNLPRPAVIERRIANTEIHGAICDDFKQNRAMVRDIYGSKFLVTLKTLGNLANKSQGWDWVVNLCHQCDLQDPQFRQANLLALFTQITHSVAGTNRLASILARIIRDVDNFHANNFVMDVSRRAMRDQRPDMIIGEIVERRRKYWVNRCKRNAKGRYEERNPATKAHMIASQIRSKTLRQTKIKVGSDGVVSMDQISHDLAFVEVIGRFVAKRRKFAKGVDIDMTNLNTTIRTVDEAFNLPYLESFAKMYQHSRDYIDEFQRELSTTFAHVLSAAAHGEDLKNADLAEEYLDEGSLPTDNGHLWLDHFGMHREEVTKPLTIVNALPDWQASKVADAIAEIRVNDALREIASLDQVVGGFIAWDKESTAQLGTGPSILPHSSAWGPQMVDYMVHRNETLEEMKRQGVTTSSDLIPPDEYNRRMGLDGDHVPEPEVEELQHTDENDEVHGDVGEGEEVEGDDDDGWGLDDEIGGADDGLLVVRMELAEDYPLLSENEILQVIEKVGEQCTVEEYATIKPFASSFHRRAALTRPLVDPNTPDFL